MIRNGADAIAGSHSHCLQSLDFYHGKPIANSLGNLVFDGAATITRWNEGALLRLYLSTNGRIAGTALVIRGSMGKS